MDPLVSYLHDGSLPVATLLSSLEASRLPLAYDSLLDLARRTSASKLADQVHELQGLDKERRELQARDAPPEVIPVMAVSTFYLRFGQWLISVCRKGLFAEEARRYRPST